MLPYYLLGLPHDKSGKEKTTFFSLPFGLQEQLDIMMIGRV